jgi:hypothetical protein
MEKLSAVRWKLRRMIPSRSSKTCQIYNRWIIGRFWQFAENDPRYLQRRRIHGARMRIPSLRPFVKAVTQITLRMEMVVKEIPTACSILPNMSKAEKH